MGNGNNPYSEELFFHVYEVPAKRSNGYCFGAGVPITFQNVDWFGGGAIETREQLVQFISGKQYCRPGFTYLVLANDPAWTFSFRKPITAGFPLMEKVDD
jgi:hypothetical protein